LFNPIAPSVLVFASGKAPPVERIEAPADSPWVAWQHLGAGYGSSPAGYSPYRSRRVNRDDGQPRQEFGTVTNQLDAAPLRGRSIRLRCAMRAEVTNRAGTGQMWLRVDKPNQKMGFFDNMDNRPVTSAEWVEPEIVGTVDADAVSINYGAFLQGSGVVEVDDFRLEAKKADGAWESIPLVNGGFEQGNGSSAQGWYVPTGAYIGTLTKQGARQGAQMMRIASSRATAPGQLFASLPAHDETIDADLVHGLRCRVRLTLPSVDNHTQPPADVMKLGKLRAEIEAARGEAMTAGDEAVRMAGVATIWNVIQHFWPYFDVVRPDWDGALDRALARAIQDRTPEDHAHSLRLMTSVLEDGHVGVSPKVRTTRAWTPLQFAWAEGRMVVTDSGDSLVRRGDVVRSIDGRNASAKLDSIMATRSGTERWRRVQALRLVDRGDSGSVARLELERSSGTTTVNIPRSTRPVFPPRKPDPVIELEPGIWYVDLERSRMGQIDSVMKQLAGAKGVIFDMRGYPNGTHPVLGHLSDEDIQSPIWRVPRVICPDRKDAPEWDESGRWTMTPVAPRILGKAVFLIGPGAISYAESVLGIVEAYHLGELVGEPTAGTNGNINQFNLAGGVNVVFTGMRVVKNDGSEHHLVGIRPTVPVTRTIAGIRAGHDEVLDRGLAIVRGAASPR
jgi:C-terminal processing protease CtpA/Prc